MDTKTLKPLYNENYSTSHRGISEDNYKANIPRVSNNTALNFENTTGGEHQDITVKNGDFFAALHMLMKNKHNYLRNGGSQQQDDNHKVKRLYSVLFCKQNKIKAETIRII